MTDRCQTLQSAAMNAHTDIIASAYTRTLYNGRRVHVKIAKRTYHALCRGHLWSVSVSLDPIRNTLLPESSILPLGSVVVAVVVHLQGTLTTMAQLVSTLKIAQLSPQAIANPASIMRLTLAPPKSSAKVTAADVRRTMEDAGWLPPAVKVALYYKDEEGDFVMLASSEAAWPSCCISDGVLKAWYICVPEAPATTPSTPALPAAPATTPSTPARTCLGPHLHQPEKKKLTALDKTGFDGYSFLAAASEGCAPCVEYWLDKGVDPNFESASEAYTAMDCVLWAEKKSHIDASSAKQVKDILVAAGGRANKK